MSEDRRAVLEAIAYGQGSTPSERLKAIELLDRLAMGVDDRFTFNLSGLEGEALDRELEGFMHPGFVPGPEDPMRAMPERWQRRVDREVRSRVKRLATNLDERVQVAVAKALAKERQTDEKPQQQERGNVVPLRPERELRRHDERPLMSPGEAERERQMAAAHVRDHVPEGIPAEALRRSGRATRAEPPGRGLTCGVHTFGCRPPALVACAAPAAPALLTRILLRRDATPGGLHQAAQRCARIPGTRKG